MDTPWWLVRFRGYRREVAGRIDHKPIIDRHGGQRIEGSTMIFSVRHPEARLTGSRVFRDYLARTQPPEAISE